METKTILHLVLKHCWYDMIASGIKREEYREISKWNRLLSKHFDQVCFHRGYTNVTQYFDIDDITTGRGNKEWGAPDYDVVVIKFH